MSDIDVASISAAVQQGDRRALGRAITLIESRRPADRQNARELLDQLAPYAGNSVRIGISGAPGAGKSTFIESLGNYLIDQGHRVAVLAVDPSSALSGGSILGDKTRMEILSRRTEAFIRPSPSGDTLGGVARRTREHRRPLLRRFNDGRILSFIPFWCVWNPAIKKWNTIGFCAPRTIKHSIRRL